MDWREVGRLLHQQLIKETQEGHEAQKTRVRSPDSDLFMALLSCSFVNSAPLVDYLRSGKAFSLSADSCEFLAKVISEQERKRKSRRRGEKAE